MRNNGLYSLVAHAIAGILLTVQAGPASASLIENGSFETPDVGPTGVVSIPVGLGPPGFGWTVDAGDVEVAGELHPALPGPSFDGQQHLDLNGVMVGTLSQGFATVAGVDYEVSFVYASNYAHHDSENPALATVRIADIDSGADLVSPLAIAHGTSSSTDLDWASEVLTFTATGAVTSLEFSSDSVDTPFGGILLDDVEVVPEPGATLLLLVGFLMLATRGLRSRADAGSPR